MSDPARPWASVSDPSAVEDAPDSGRPSDIAVTAEGRSRPGRVTGLALRNRLATLLLADLALGVVCGLVWLWWSPRTIAYRVPDARNHPIIIPAGGENQVAGDGRFLVVTAVLGLALGLSAWLFARTARGPVTLLAVAVTAALSSLLARTVGEVLAPGTNSGALNSIVHPPLTLHGWAILLVQPFVAVLAYTGLAGLSNDPDFVAPPGDRDRMPDGEFERPVDPAPSGSADSDQPSS